MAGSFRVENEWSGHLEIWGTMAWLRFTLIILILAIKLLYQIYWNNIFWLSGSWKQEMLEIQPGWPTELDPDLQQHGEQLYLCRPPTPLPLGCLRLDHQSLSPGHHALLWLSLQVPPPSSLLTPHSSELELEMFQEQCSGTSLSDHWCWPPRLLVLHLVHVLPHREDAENDPDDLPLPLDLIRSLRLDGGLRLLPETGGGSLGQVLKHRFYWRTNFCGLELREKERKRNWKIFWVEIGLKLILKRIWQRLE